MPQYNAVEKTNFAFFWDKIKSYIHMPYPMYDKIRHFNALKTKQN